MDWLEPCAAQLGGVKSPVAREEWPQAPVHTGDCLESSFPEKDTGVLGAQQEHEPAICVLVVKKV